MTTLRPRASANVQRPLGDRAAAAQYIAQMALELERLANTANLELASYFLALARAEAEQVASGGVAGSQAPDNQAPYRAE